ncbi:MAG: carbohydrate binding domain-containing protein [Verrucomicrobiae bacterium]|nr:carbohydrate binding domain-containing protein [Verrucomicrobiae bacterium]
MSHQFVRIFWMIVLALAGAAVSAEELVPFVLPWDDGSAPALVPAALERRAAGSEGPVRVWDGHLVAGNGRLRLFGVNVTAGACFPSRDKAEAIAARMAKYGINAVRFHFLDSTWGETRLIDYDSGSNLDFNADALERLDFFIHALERRGIYINLNLLVGRRFGVGDGVDPRVNDLDWKTAHAIGFFHEPHLKSQKEYARRLLTHKNPHTGRTYAEDPAVAMVEINNENGLIHQWFGRQLDALPAPFAADLARQWNAWLAARYGKTARLAEGWKARNEAPGAEVIANGEFGKGIEAWSIERHGGAEADVTFPEGAMRLAVRKTGAEGWHVQVNQPGLKIRAGQLYTVRFRAAADSKRKVDVTLMQAHEPWESLGFGSPIELGPDWREFSFVFLAPRDDDNARLGFMDLNQAGATFRFDGISMRPGGRTGLGENESLEKGTIAVPVSTGARGMTPEARRDWVRFLWETERRHWNEMRRFLREELHVAAPIVGTIVGNSTPNLMADMDVVDTHAYWQHPRFPGRDWDQDNWIVSNKSMVDEPQHATLTRLAFCRVAGKPHMVSEYNHPAPNPHASEGPLMLAAFAALQDWDALFLYTYGHREADIPSGAMTGFFDLGRHTTAWANVPAASALFLRGDIAPAPEVLALPFDPEREIGHIATAGRHWGVVAVEHFGADLRHAISRRIQLDPKAVGPNPAAPSLDGATRFGPADGRISWELVTPGKGLFVVRSPRTKALIGAAEGRGVDFGDGVAIDVGSTVQGWCTVALTALEGEFPAPKRALLVATGFTENTGMGWKNAEKTTVGRDWGSAPVLVECIPARIRIALPKGATLPIVRALDARGQPTGDVGVNRAPDGSAEFQIGPAHRTLWYEMRPSGAE